MNCSKARQRLFPQPQLSVPAVDTPQAQKHVQGCEACQRYFAAHAEWSRALQEVLGTEPAPEPLHDRVVALLREGSTKRPQARWLRVGGTAAVAVVALLVWFAYVASVRNFFRSVCDDHARYMTAQSELQSANAAEIEAWLSPKTEFSVRVPSFESAELVGARLCFLNQRRAALVFYRKHGRPVSLFEFSGSALQLAALDRAVVDGQPMRKMSYKGFALAAFEHRGVTWVLVSDLRESELLELASAAQIRARGH